MKTLVIVFILLLEVLTGQAASWAFLSQGRQGRVVGGHEAKAHSHPYIVSLQFRFLWIRAHFCGGTLLSKSWILTAGHCLEDSWIVRWLAIDAVAGAHDVDSFDSKVQIAEINKRIVHPDYKGGIGAHDIAVLKTRTPFKFTKEVKPIRLPAANFKYEKMNSLTLSGWGALRTTSFIPDIPAKLQEVGVSYMSYKECYAAIDDIKETYESNPLSEKSNMCTGPVSGGIAACNGDSGGPLVYYTHKPTDSKPTQSQSQVTLSSTAKSTTTTEDDDYDIVIDLGFLDYDVKGANVNTNEIKAKPKEDNVTAVILGVVSWGVSPCGEVGAPTVYTKVTPYLNFIKKHMKS